MPTLRPKTDRECLLAAVRRGSLPALLALYDCWIEEGAVEQAGEYDRLAHAACAAVRADGPRHRQVGRTHLIYLAFKAFVYRVNRAERCWRLPAAARVERTPAWEWMRGMAGQLHDEFRRRFSEDVARAIRDGSRPGL